MVYKVCDGWYLTNDGGSRYILAIEILPTFLCCTIVVFSGKSGKKIMLGQDR